MSKIHEALQKAEQEKKQKIDTPDSQQSPLLIPKEKEDIPQIHQDSGIPVDKGNQEIAFQKNVICFNNSDILISEQFRNLYATLQYSFTNGNTRSSHCIGVSSPGKGEGKSTITINLGTTMASDSNKSILIMDADLRNPSIHKLIDLQREPGLSNILSGINSLEECIFPTILPNLKVLPAGKPVKNPVELLGSQQFKQLVKTLKGQFHIVLIDTPPVLPVTETKVLATQLDGMVLVVEANRTQQNTLEKSIEILNYMKAPLLGVILNKVKRISNEYYYYYGE